jgi:hypothetical protein
MKLKLCYQKHALLFNAAQLGPSLCPAQLFAARATAGATTTPSRAELEDAIRLLYQLAQRDRATPDIDHRLRAQQAEDFAEALEEHLAKEP